MTIENFGPFIRSFPSPQFNGIDFGKILDEELNTHQSGDISYLENAEDPQKSLNWLAHTLENLAKNKHPKIPILNVEQSNLIDSWKNELRQMDSALYLLQKNDISGLKTLMREELRKNNRFVLPIQFINEKTGQKEIIACVFENYSDGIIRMRLLDKGQGAETEHPTLKVIGGKIKKSYTDLPLRLRDATMLSDKNQLGETFLHKLCELNKGSAKGSFSLIYGMFHNVIGEPYPEDLVRINPENHSEVSHLWFSGEMGVSLSRRGSTIEHLVNLSLRDLVISRKNPSKEDVSNLRRLKIGIKMQAWMDVVQALRSNKLPDTSTDALRKQLKDFNYSIVKAYERKWITENDLIFWRNVDNILAGLIPAQRAPSEDQKVIANESVRASKEQCLFDVRLPSTEKIDAYGTRPTQLPSYLNAVKITPETITETLRNINNYIKDNPRCHRFHVVNGLLKKIPLDKDFWQAIPQEKVLETLQHLKRALMLTGESFHEEKDQIALYAEMCLLSASSLVMVDILARRLNGENDLKLQNFAIEIPDLGEIFYFQNREQAQRLRAIREYVLNEQSNGRKVLSLDPISLPIGAWEDIVRSPGDNSLKTLVEYHRQFGDVNGPQDLAKVSIKRFYKETPHGRVLDRKPDEVAGNEKLPKVFNDYYYFHVVVSKLFSRPSQLAIPEFHTLISRDASPIFIEDFIGIKPINIHITYGPHSNVSNNYNKVITHRQSRLTSSAVDKVYATKSLEDRENKIVLNGEAVHFRYDERAKESQFQQSEIWLSDLKRIIREPDLQISMVIQWLNQHPEASNFREIQDMIEFIFLRPGSFLNGADVNTLQVRQALDYIQKQRMLASQHISSLGSYLFWTTLELHVHERVNPADLDSWINKAIKIFNAQYDRVANQFKENEPEKFYKYAHDLSAFAAYFYTQKKELSNSDAEKLLEMMSTIAVLRSNQSDIPNWLLSDCRQYLIDHRERLEGVMKVKDHLPNRLFTLNLPFLESLSDTVTITISNSGRFECRGNGHLLDLDLFEGKAEFDGRAVNLFDSDLNPSIYKDEYYSRVRKTSAEKLLKEWLGKTVVVMGIEQKVYQNPIEEDPVPIHHFILHTTEGEFQLRLNPPIIWSSNTGLIHPRGTLKFTPEESAIWDHHPRPPKVRKVEEGVFELLDGSGLFVETAHGWLTYERKACGKTSDWYRKLNLPIPLPRSFDGCEVWHKKSLSSSSLPEFLIIDKGIAYELVKDGDRTFVYKLDSHGKRTGEILVNPESSVSLDFIKGLSSRHYLRLWTDGTSLVKAECTDLGLTFIKTANSWICEQYSGWTLSKVEKSGLLGKHDGFLRLVKNEQEIYLVPIRERNEELPVGRLGQEHPYVTYQKDPVTGHLIANSDEGALYLTYLMLSQGYESEALEALKSLKMKAPWTQQHWQLFLLIVSSHNHSAEATALKILAAAMVIQNNSLARFGLKESLNGSTQYNFWIQVAKVLPNYLNLLGTEFSRLSKSYQLPEETITKIIHSLHQFKRNDGYLNENDISPSETLRRSTHYHFHPEYVSSNFSMNSEIWKEYWIDNGNWSEDLLLGHSQDYAEKRRQLSKDLWLDKPDYRFMRNPFFSTKLHFAMPKASQSVASHTDKFKYSLNGIKEAFWPTLKKLYDLPKDHRNKVLDIDLEIYLMYKSLKDDVLNGGNKDDWEQGVALLHALWVVRANPDKFIEKIKVYDKWYGDYSIVERVILSFEPRDLKFSLNQANSSRTVSYFEPQIISFQPSPMDIEKPPAPLQKETSFTSYTPLLSLLNQYFDIEKIDEFADKKFVIDTAPDSPHIVELKDAFEKSTEPNQPPLSSKQFNSYTLKNGVVEKDFKVILVRSKDSLSSEELVKRMIKKANYPTDEELDTLPSGLRLEGEIRNQQKRSGQLHQLNLLDVLLTFDPTNPSAIKKLNPCLTDSVLNDLHKLCLEYFEIETKKNQLSEAINCLDGTSEGIENCAEILAKERTFSIEDHWILALYQLMSGNVLRSDPDQAKLLISIVKEIFREGPARDPERLRQVFFEFQAGGGKTKVIAVILAAYAKRYGKTPVFISLPQLFDISNQDLNDSLNRFLRKGARPIELSLDQIPTLKELANLRDTLMNPPDKDLCFIIGPETYHSLWLEYQNGLLFGENERVQIIDQILIFLEDNGINLLDEAHRNANPTVEANVAFGKGIEMPPYVTRFYSQVMRFIIQDPRLSQIVGLLDRRQARMSEVELKEVKRTIARVFAAKILNINESNVDENLISYLIDLNQDPSRYLLGSNNGDNVQKLIAKKMATLRGFLNTILPFALELAEDIDHGPSINKDNEVEAPRNHKEITTAKFENPELSLALTIKGFLQRGFTEVSQVKRLVALMQEELSVAGNTFENEDLFLSWQKGSAIKYALSDLKGTISEKVWNDLFNILKTNPDVIFKYLELKPLKEVLIFPYKITSTASRLAYGFYANIFFSATLGPSEKYPFFGDDRNYIRDLKFLAKVIQRGSAVPNEEFVWFKNNDIPSFLAQLPIDKLKSGRLAGVLNFGGTAPGKSSKDWAIESLKFFKKEGLPYQAVAYLHEEGNEKSLYLLTDPDKKPIKLSGSDLKKQLEELNLAHLKIFKIYNPDDTTGTDLMIEWNGLMAVTTGEDPATDELAQTLLRMRKFIRAMKNQKAGQGVIWCINESMKPKLSRLLKKPEGAEFAPKDCFMWSLENYRKKIQSEIISGAYQELEGVFVESVRRELRGKRAEEQVSLFQRRFQNGFVKINHYDPFDKYGYSTSPKPTETLLNDVVKALQNDFKINIEQNTWAKNRINQIIKRTAKVVPQISGDTQRGLNSQSHQRQRTYERQKTNAQSIRYESSRAPRSSNSSERKEGEYPNKELALVEPAIFDPKNNNFIKTASVVFGISALPKALYMTVDSIFAGESTTDNRWSLNTLKTSDHILLVQDGNGPVNYILLSQENAKAYLQQISKNSVMPGRKVALLGADGSIVENGKGSQGFTSATLLALNETKAFQEIKAWTSWINGQSSEMNSTVKDITSQHRTAVQSLFGIVHQNQVSPSGIQKRKFDSLMYKEMPAEETILIDRPSFRVDNLASGRPANEKEKPIKLPISDIKQKLLPQRLMALKPLELIRIEKPSIPAPKLPVAAPAAPKLPSAPLEIKVASSPRNPQKVSKKIPLKGRITFGVLFASGVIATIALAAMTFAPNSTGLYKTMLGRGLLIASGTITLIVFASGAGYFIYHKRKNKKPELQD